LEESGTGEANQRRVRRIAEVYGPLVFIMTTKGGATPVWLAYRNEDEERRLRTAAAEAAARRQEREKQAELALKAAAQARQDEIARRLAAFLQSNGVGQVVRPDQLAANPFAYQGQIVAVTLVFEQMISPNEGLFSGSGASLLVSAVPSGRFTEGRSAVVLAGRVLGNREVKLPLVGATLVPHLSFVGSDSCEHGCGDYYSPIK
jgi:hypothetical protein